MAANIEASVKGLLQAVPPKKAAASESLPRIFRIPPLVRENKDFYEPQMVSIGPYHYGSERTQWMERHKHRYLRDFLDRHAQIGVEAYIQEMRTLEERARRCYTDDINFNNDDFAQMLLLDGCFILELIFKLETEESDTLCQPALGLKIILSDLLLLENQIPFFILDKLYSTTKGKNNSSILPLVSRDLRSLVRNNLLTKYLHDSMKSSQVNTPLEGIHHLLHLYHDLSKPSRETEKINDSSAHNGNTPLIIPSASQLDESSEAFIRINGSARDIFDVTFEMTVMRIPQQVIDSTRQTLLMNLHAFEQHMPMLERRWTGLMVLMSCIVKNEKDLEVLQRRGIVLNLFPSEEEAIQFFRQMNQRVAPDFNSHCFANLFEQVNEYCQRPFVRYRAELVHTYFDSPWAVLTLVNSITVLVLSAVQTFYTVYTATHNKGS